MVNTITISSASVFRWCTLALVVGVHALAVASAGFPVFCVEPSPNHVALLRESVRRNPGFQSRLKILPVAASNRHTSFKLAIYASNAGGSHLIDISASKPEAVEVISLTLDDLVHLVPFPSALLKVDIETHECTAMQNASKLLTQIEIPAIFMEYSIGGHYDASCLHQMAKTLHSLGYKRMRNKAHATAFDILDWEKVLPKQMNDVIILKDGFNL